MPFLRIVSIINKFKARYISPEGGLPEEIDGDARRKIRIKPPKETNLGVAPVLFYP